jgi:hypothetical protein
MMKLPGEWYSARFPKHDLERHEIEIEWKTQETPRETVGVNPRDGKLIQTMQCSPYGLSSIHQRKVVKVNAVGVTKMVMIRVVMQ